MSDDWKCKNCGATLCYHENCRNCMTCWQCEATETALRAAAVTKLAKGDDK